VESPSEKLEVVGDDDESARGDERRQARRDEEDAGDPDRDGTCQSDGRGPDECPARQLRSERPPVQLVECVRADADAEEEGPERSKETVEVNGRCRGGAERDVAEMPRRVRRVQQRDGVPPPAGAKRIEGRALKPALWRRLPSLPT
jgi:hypothetical protein